MKHIQKEDIKSYTQHIIIFTENAKVRHEDYRSYFCAFPISCVTYKFPSLRQMFPEISDSITSLKTEDDQLYNRRVVHWALIIFKIDQY